jgi:SSS family solute:Na+ symporter
VRFGRWSGVVILAASILIAIEYTTTTTPLFEKVQTVFFFIAPPFAVVFTLGLLWRRANGIAALTTMVAGFLCSWLLFQFELLGRFNTFNHRALGTWICSMTLMIVVSLLTAPPPLEKTEGIIWNKSFAMLPPDVQRRYTGWKDWRIWWALFIGLVLCIYAFFVWYRFQHPW